MTVIIHVPRREFKRPSELPERRPMDDMCLCPGCYYVITENSELCLRCALDGCDHENNRHA